MILECVRHAEASGAYFLLARLYSFIYPDLDRKPLVFIRIFNPEAQPRDTGNQTDKSAVAETVIQYGIQFHLLT